MREGRSPYVLPCQEHRSCKRCLQVARRNRNQDFKCPYDKTAIDIRTLKQLQKDADVVGFIEAWEEWKDRKMEEGPDQADGEQIAADEALGGPGVRDEAARLGEELDS